MSILDINRTFFPTAVIIGTVLANFWIYRIFQINALLGILLILESIFLFLMFFSKLKKIFRLNLIILLSLSIFLTINYFDKSVFITTEIESIQKLKNHEYYANELGKIYKNKAGLLYFGELKPFMNRANHKLFSYLDIKTYFGFDNQIIYYPTFFFPLFVIGFLYLLINPRLYLLIYIILAFFFSVIIYLENQLNPILLFPLFNVCIGMGFLQVAKFLKPALSLQ